MEDAKEGKGYKLKWGLNDYKIFPSVWTAPPVKPEALDDFVLNEGGVSEEESQDYFHLLM